MASNKEIEQAVVDQIALLEGKPPKLDSGDKLPVTITTDPVSKAQTFTYNRKVILIVSNGNIEKPDMTARSVSGNPVESHAVSDPLPDPKDEEPPVQDTHIASASRVVEPPKEIAKAVEEVREGLKDFPDVDEEHQETPVGEEECFMVLSSNDLVANGRYNTLDEAKRYAQVMALQSSGNVCFVLKVAGTMSCDFKYNWKEGY